MEETANVRKLAVNEMHALCPKQTTFIDRQMVLT
jgi:hypothetical protein